MSEFGKKQWLIPDMFWPVKDQGEYLAHEGICVVNANDEDCEIEIDFIYTDRDPIRGFKTVCPAWRTNHIRTDEICVNGEPLPRGVGYAAIVRCSVPAAVQYTRVDVTQPALTLMTTMAYPVD